jgi:uncharacterized protein YndB with AHSA1/START domain
MRNVTLNRQLKAPQSAVWAVLADYQNISSWNSGVKKSFLTGEASEGVGATRHCDLSPAGGLEETIRVWEPSSKLVISIDSAKKIPIKQAEMTFTIDDAGDSTDYTMSYNYEPKGGPLARIFGPMLDKQLRKGFGGFIDDLERAAQAQTSA